MHGTLPAQLERMRLRRPVGLIVLAPLLLLACGDAEPVPASPSPASGPTVHTPKTELDAFDPDPCTHITGPVQGTESVEVGLGRAHAVARYFGPALGNRAIDQALAGALDGSAGQAERFAVSVGGCAGPLSPRDPAGPREVRMVDGTAIVPVSNTPPVIPEGARAVAIDLRHLVPGPDLEAALEATITAVVPGDLVRPGGEGRVCRGLPDEVWTVVAGTPTLYGCGPDPRGDRALVGRGPARTIFVVTDGALAPAAARWAIALRLTRKAHLVGEHVLGAVAEMFTTQVGTRGVSSRVELASLGGKALPDIVYADVRTNDLQPAFASLVDKAVEVPAVKESTRAPLGDWQPLVDRPPTEPVTLGAARASVVAAFGAIDRFFPFFAEVGPYPTEIVPGLVAGIDKAAEPRLGAIGAMYPLLVPLQDGHAWPVSLEAGAVSSGDGPSVAVLAVGERFIVARSVHPEVLPGDELLLVDGAPALDRWTLVRGRISGSVAHQRAIAASYLVTAETKTISVRTGEGAPRTVTVTPSATPVATVSMYNRPPGTLADLGAPELFYVSLDDGAIGSTKPAAIAEEMAKAEGVVLDMRGYPGAAAYRLLAMTIPDTSKGPPNFIFETRADGATPTEPQQQILRDMLSSKQGQVFTGKVVLLVGPDSQSSAEHLSTFFRTSGRGPIIGESTSGANGNITGAQVNAALGVTFTGMHITNPDGSRFHGLGLVPDIESAPTPASLSAGEDVVLTRAMAELRKLD